MLARNDVRNCGIEQVPTLSKQETGLRRTQSLTTSVTQDRDWNTIDPPEAYSCMAIHTVAAPRA